MPKHFFALNITFILCFLLKAGAQTSLVSLNSQNNLASDEGKKVKHLSPIPKGTINWVISIPYVNFFHIKTINGDKNFSGFFGAETGLEYYYRDNQYLSANTGVAVDFITPVPASIDYGDEVQHSSSIFFNVRNNHRFGRFEAGYGINLSRLRWSTASNSDSAFVFKYRNNINIGFSFIASYRVSGFFKLGLLYQPGIVYLNSKQLFGYQHLVSAEAIFNVPVNKLF